MPRPYLCFSKFQFTGSGNVDIFYKLLNPLPLYIEGLDFC